MGKHQIFRFTRCLSWKFPTIYLLGKINLKSSKRQRKEKGLTYIHTQCYIIKTKMFGKIKCQISLLQTSLYFSWKMRFNVMKGMYQEHARFWLFYSMTFANLNKINYTKPCPPLAHIHKQSLLDVEI